MVDLDLNDGGYGYKAPLMPRKKLKSSGPMPVNHLKHENVSGTKQQRVDDSDLRFQSNNISTRYGHERYNRSRTQNGSPLGSSLRQRYAISEDLEMISDLKGSSEAVSLLDSTKGSHATVTRFSFSGDLTTLDWYGQPTYQSRSVLHFFTDSTGPRVHFTIDIMENKETQIDIARDCAKVLIDECYTCVGFVLLTPRRMRLDRRSRLNPGQREDVSPTTVLQFTTKDTGKIEAVHSSLKSLESSKVRLVPTQDKLVKELQQLGALEQEPVQETTINCVSEKKSRFPHKETFPSLDPRRGGSRSSNSALKIVVPSSPERADENTHIPKISSSSFYGGKSNLRLHALSNQDISRQTRSKTPKLSQSKLWIDDETEHETPEKFEPQLCYKFDDGVSYTITNQDFKCLYNHDWINDTILDFFTKYYVEKAIRDSVVANEEVYLMSSFFYTKLISDPTDYYGNIKKWVSNSNLFQKKYVVVPINMNFHWFGCIITNLDSLIGFFEGLTDDEKAKLNPKADSPGLANRRTKALEEGPPRDIVSRLSSRSNTPLTNEEDDDEITVSAPIVKILTFDSLRQTHSREIDPLKEFLIAYAKDKYSINLDKSLIKMRTCAVPQQPNLSDCGVHVILNTMKFFENPQGTIEVWRSAKSRSKGNTKVINEYFEKNKRSSARRDLRDILWNLQKEQMKANEDLGDRKVSAHKEEEEGDIEIIEELSKHPVKALHENCAPESEPKEHDTHQQEQSLPPKAEEVLIESFASITDAQKTPERNSEEDHEKTPINPRLSIKDNDNDKDESSPRIKSSPLGLQSQRRILKSSPVKSSSEGVYCGISSPYFMNSDARSGQDAPRDKKTRHKSRPPLVEGDTLTKVRRDLDLELDDQVPDESISVCRSPSNVPVLTRISTRTHRVKEQWANGSDSDLHDELSTGYHIETITSD